jgi:uncharacterized protein YdaU (DUF1376 family)
MSDETAADVSDFPYMPLYIARLQRSKAWLVCKRDPALAFYSLNLWMRAWHEVPAGSIEDDDDILADAAMADPKTWDKIKEKVLRGWERRDGRLFHGFVTTIAESSFEAKTKQRRKTSAATEALARKRHDNRDDHRDDDRDDDRAAIVTDTKGREGKGKGKGEGEGEEKGQGELGSLRSPCARVSAAEQAREAEAAFDRFWPNYPRRDGKGHARKAFVKALTKTDEATIIAGLDRYRFSPDPQYIPMPATWLNEERWLSEQPDPTNKPDRHMDSFAAILQAPRPHNGREPAVDLKPQEWSEQ